MKTKAAVLREFGKPLTIDAMDKRQIKGRWVCAWD